MYCAKNSSFSSSPSLGGNTVFSSIITSKTGPARKIGLNYSPFGVLLDSRSQSVSDYRYGFNGMEADDEVKGLGNSYDFGARMYDARVGRWLSIDAKDEDAPALTPYRYGFNNPVRFFDHGGNFESDGHFWTIYLIAVMLEIPEARLIAYLAEFPDTRIPWTDKSAQQRYTWGVKGDQQHIHGLTGGNGPKMSSETAFDITVGAYVEKGELTPDRALRFQFGELLHRYGDSYAHRKLGGDGELYGREGYTFDHMASDGHAPDKLSIRGKDGIYMEYVQGLSSLLAGVYGKDASSVDLSLFQSLATYASENNSTLHGALAYQVSKMKGKSEFFVHNIVGLFDGGFDQQVQDTKKYLIKNGVSFTVDYQYNDKNELQGAKFTYSNDSSEDK